MSHCLYCDRPLALFKRLTGDGEFCSKEHRRIYQSEHNKLALERLLAAKPAPGKRTLRIVEAILPEAVLEGPPLAAFFDEYPREAVPTSGADQSACDPLFLQVFPAWWLARPEANADEPALAPGPRAALFQAEPLDPRPFEAAVRIPRVPALSIVPGPKLAETLAGMGVKIKRPDPERAGFLLDIPAALTPPRQPGRLDGAFRLFAPREPQRPRSSRLSSRAPAFARFAAEPQSPKPAPIPAARAGEAQFRRPQSPRPAMPTSVIRLGSPAPGRAGFLPAPPAVPVSTPAPRAAVDLQLRAAFGATALLAAFGKRRDPKERSAAPAGSAPECAGFLVAPPAPPVSAPSPRAGSGIQFRSPAASPLLGAARNGRGPVAPERAGFVAQPPSAPASSPAARGGNAAFRSSAAPLLATFVNGRNPGLRAAMFLAETAAPGITAGAIRFVAGAPRSFAFKQALPEQPVARIVMVMGAFLHRVARTVPQDRLIDRFELPLRPVPFPAVPPRMAFLEGRLHRTDRIGFTPP